MTIEVEFCDSDVYESKEAQVSLLVKLGGVKDLNVDERVIVDSAVRKYQRGQSWSRLRRWLAAGGDRGVV